MGVSLSHLDDLLSLVGNDGIQDLRIPGRTKCMSRGIAQVHLVQLRIS